MGDMRGECPASNSCLTGIDSGGWMVSAGGSWLATPGGCSSICKLSRAWLASGTAPGVASPCRWNRLPSITSPGC